MLNYKLIKIFFTDNQEVKHLINIYLKRNNSVIKLLIKDMFIRILPNESLFSEFEESLNCENSMIEKHDLTEKLVSKEDLDSDIHIHNSEKKIYLDTQLESMNLRESKNDLELKNFEKNNLSEKLDIPIGSEFSLNNSISDQDHLTKNVERNLNDVSSIKNMKDIFDTTHVDDSKKTLEILKCLICSFNSVDKNTFLRHNNDHNEIDEDDNDYLFRCNRGCNFVSDRFDKYNKHLFYHIHDGCNSDYFECIYAQCPLCPFASSKFQIVKSHINNFHSSSDCEYEIKHESLIKDGTINIIDNNIIKDSESTTTNQFEKNIDHDKNKIDSESLNNINEQNNAIEFNLILNDPILKSDNLNKEDLSKILHKNNKIETLLMANQDGQKLRDEIRFKTDSECLGKIKKEHQVVNIENISTDIKHANRNFNVDNQVVQYDNFRYQTNDISKINNHEYTIHDKHINQADIHKDKSKEINNIHAVNINIDNNLVVKKSYDSNLLNLHASNFTKNDQMVILIIYLKIRYIIHFL